MNSWHDYKVDIMFLATAILLIALVLSGVQKSFLTRLTGSDIAARAIIFCIIAVFLTFIIRHIAAIKKVRTDVEE